MRRVFWGEGGDRGRSDDGEGKFYTSDMNAAEKIAGVFF